MLAVVGFVLVKVAGRLNAAAVEHVAALVQMELPLVKLPMPVPAVVCIDPVQDVAFSGWNANVSATLVPPARDVELALKSDAGPYETAGIEETPPPQPAPVEPVAVACNCPGTAGFEMIAPVE